jgi:hypothetical protein
LESRNRIEKLTPEVITATLSGNAESGDYRAVTVALKDGAGVAVGGRCLVEAWLADTGYGWAVASGASGFTVASGTAADIATAGVRARGITLADGTITFHVLTDSVITYVFCVSVRGKVYTVDLAFA